jgi:hypothetical protein
VLPILHIGAGCEALVPFDGYKSNDFCASEGVVSLLLRILLTGFCLACLFMHAISVGYVA